MILSALIILLSPAAAEEEEESSADPLSTYRTPFDVLAERAIGTASVPVEFSWRRTTAQLAVSGHHSFELNNFNSVRSGLLARFPTGGLLTETALSYVWVWDTPSSELLALTPYRQPGRPRRVEVDVNIGIPLAEGVVTTFPRLFPAVQMVLCGYVGLRYLFYPQTFTGLTAREIGGALLSPTLSDAEVSNLEDRRLDAMRVDSARYGVMAGLGNDFYFRQGLFVSPRVMFALPIAAPATGTDLLFWADFSVAVGIAL